MKNVTFAKPGATIFIFKIHVYSAVIAYLDDITNLEILPYILHFSEVMIYVNRLLSHC